MASAVLSGRRADQARPHSRPADWLVLLLFVAAAIVLIAAVAEIALRIGRLEVSAAADPRCAGSDAAQATQKGLFVPDPQAGYVMRPNLCIRLHTDEYDEVLRTNAQGLAGPGVPETKAPDEFRVVVLGDSYTVGGQVPYERTFPAELEQDLRDDGYSNVRVINAGVGGYTTFNEAGLLRKDITLLQPDVVIVAAFVGNDVAENVLATVGGYRVDPNHPKGLTFGPAASDLVQESIGWFPRNGRAAPSADGVPQSTPIVSLKTALRQTWDASRRDSLVLGALFGAPPDPSIGTAPGARPPSKDQKQLNLSSFEWTIVRDIPHTYWLDQAWPLFGQYLSDIRTTAELVEAPVLVVVIPQVAQVEPAERARTMADFRFTEAEVDWTRPQRELKAQADTARLAVLDLLPAFQESPLRDSLYFPVDQHFTATGHHFTAELLAQSIVSRGWLH